MLQFKLMTLVASHVAVLLIGWNMLPQPKWVRRLWLKMTGKTEEE